MFNNSKLVFRCFICLLFLSNCKTSDVLTTSDISFVNNQNRNTNAAVNNQNRNTNVNIQNPYSSNPYSSSTQTPYVRSSEELKRLKNTEMESIVYSTLIERVFIYSNKEEFKPVRQPGIIGFRKNSVEPTGFTEFAERNPFNLSNEVFEDFKTANKKKLVLDDDYGVKSAFYPISGEGDTQEVLKTAKTKKVKGIKQEKIGVLIGLSRIGFSKDLTQTLLYAEYTTPKSHLKMYIYTPFEITENGVYAQRKEMKIDYIQ